MQTKLATGTSLFERDINIADMKNPCLDSSTEKACTVYAVLFTSVFGVTYIIEREGLFSWIMLATNMLWLILRKPAIMPLYSAFLLPNEFTSYCSVAAWLLLSPSAKRERATSFDNISLLLILVILVNSTIQAAILGTLANTVTYGCYICLLALVCWKTSRTTGAAELLFATKCFAAAEIAASMLITVRFGLRPSDVHYGTFGNAHYLGVICSMMLLVLLNEAALNRRWISLESFLGLGLMIAIYLADAKAAVGAGAICVALLLILRRAGTQNRATSSLPLVITLILIVAIIVVGSFLLQTSSFRSYTTSNNFPLSWFFNEYVYYDGLGVNKFNYIAGTLSEMLENGKIFFGYGLGDYGSRFANLFGYTYTYRPPGALNDLVALYFDSRMLPEYAYYASKYNAEVVSVIQWYSAVLSYPFSSVVALMAETGIVGIALLARILLRARLNYTAQLVVAFFFGACITDLYFDHIQSVGIAILVAAVFSVGQRLTDMSVKTP